jgi:serine protease Do
VRKLSVAVWLGGLCLASTAWADLARRKDAIVEVVQKVSPAVVHIGTESVVDPGFRQDRTPLEEFFFGGLGERRRQVTTSLGSGVIIDPSGIILTNDHVIRGAAAIHIVLADGRQLDAEVIGSDADNDLAVLRVENKTPLPVAKLGTSSDLMIGETVIAIGSPFGLKKTVTAGVLSATGRTFKADNRTYNDFLQIDASINPGNSGGPLLNVDGDIIGINTAIFASAQGIGFAIPADKVRRIVTELTQFGKVRPAWVGIEVDALTPQLARNLGWDRNFGALVVSVDPGSPAERAGVQKGDIVTHVAGTQVEDPEDFRVRMRGYPARSAFNLGLFRRGPREMSLTPVEFPAQLVEGLVWERLGLKFKAEHGGLMVVGVRRGSTAAQIGFQPGDVVQRINNQPIPSWEAFRDLILSARARGNVLLLVRRGRFGYHVPMPF